MTYINVHGEEVENEYEEKLINKYKDKYRCVRRVFPGAYKLPEDEIEKMRHIIRYEGETYDEAEKILEKYIEDNKSKWKSNYLSKPSLWDYMAQEFKKDGQDVLYGMDRALSGMSLGAYDWLKRKTNLGFNEKEYMAEKEKQGSDIGAKIGGAIAEIGGNAIGGGAGIVKGLGQLGLKGTKLATAATGLEGMVEGTTNSDTINELPLNVLYNGTIGAVSGGVGDKIMKFGGKMLKPYLNNIKEKSPIQFNRYVQNHADDELMEFIPSRKQIINYNPESTFNINPYITSDMAKDIILLRANQRGIKLGGDLEHYLGKRGRNNYVRTLKNTLEKPDIIYQKIKQDSKGNNVLREYNIKKYNGKTHIQKDPFFDFIVKQNGDLYTKFRPDDIDYSYRDLLKPKDTVKNMSFHSKLIGAEGTYPQSTSNPYITLKKTVVNPKLKNFWDLYQTETPYQQVLLGEIVNNSMKKAQHKSGSLYSIHKMDQNLDKMMQSKQFNNQALKGIKQNFDEVLEPVKEEARKNYMPFDNMRDMYSRMGGSIYPMWQQSENKQ